MFRSSRLLLARETPRAFWLLADVAIKHERNIQQESSVRRITMALQMITDRVVKAAAGWYQRALAFELNKMGT